MLRTGHKSARGVAQDAPFIIAARLERRAGALTGTAISYEGMLVAYGNKFISHFSFSYVNDTTALTLCGP